MQLKFGTRESFGKTLQTITKSQLFWWKSGGRGCDPEMHFMSIGLVLKHHGLFIITHKYYIIWLCMNSITMAKKRVTKMLPIQYLYHGDRDDNHPNLIM